MTNVKVVTPFNGITATPNALLIVGGAMTVTLALAVAVLGPSSVVASVTLLGFTPAVVPITFTTTEHGAPTGSVLAARLTVLVPATAVAAPLFAWFFRARSKDS